MAFSLFLCENLVAALGLNRLSAGEHCSLRFCIEIISVYAKTNPLQSILHTEMPICVVESSQFVMNEMYTGTSNQNHKF